MRRRKVFDLRFNRLHPLHFGKFVQQDALHSRSKREFRHRTDPACPQPLQLQNALPLPEPEELNIAAVGKKERTDRFEGVRDS